MGADERLKRLEAARVPPWHPWAPIILAVVEQLERWLAKRKGTPA